MKYKTEPYPPQPETGMIAGKIPNGARVTHVESGKSIAVDFFRSQIENRNEAIQILEFLIKSNAA